MNWKTVGKGFLSFCALILIPFSWYAIIISTYLTFGEGPCILSAILLIVFSIMHFALQYDWI